MDKNELLKGIEKAYEEKDKLREIIDQYKEIILIAMPDNAALLTIVAAPVVKAPFALLKVNVAVSTTFGLAIIVPL